ncbi:phosphoribosylamine--glycine ligase [Pelagibacteraceae bacterium]|nr:phosphoribosylamine--glycine ligase [Pelagibacteraceae bacterium]
MNIALIGSGGREHAICVKLVDSKITNKVFCIPGNAGTSTIAQNLDIDFLNFKLLLRSLKFYNIDLVVVGPELPLVNGIVDFLEKNNIRVFGPNKFAAKLEGSKAFMKSVCKKKNIPTANYKVCKSERDVKLFLKKNNMPIVVKADGLAAGKGVTICKNKKKIMQLSKEIFLGKFKSSKKLILEEFLEGEEASYFIVADKKKFSFIGSAQDHKRVGENETGPNTGGMGAYSPAPIITKSLEKKIIEKIIKPTLKYFKDKGKPFTGFLYAGLMIKNNKPYLIEYNVRMGDPECQVILPRLRNDLAELLDKLTKNRLGKLKIKWKKNKCMTIVVCSKGYPGKYKKNKIINNFIKINLDKNSYIYHAGTKNYMENFLTTGGRVLNVTSSGNSFFKIRKNIIKIIKRLNWKDGFFRKDIGWRVI